MRNSSKFVIETLPLPDPNPEETVSENSSKCAIIRCLLANDTFPSVDITI